MSPLFSQLIITISHILSPQTAPTSGLSSLTPSCSLSPPPLRSFLCNHPTPSDQPSPSPSPPSRTMLQLSWRTSSSITLRILPPPLISNHPSPIYHQPILLTHKYDFFTPPSFFCPWRALRSHPTLFAGTRSSLHFLITNLLKVRRSYLPTFPPLLSFYCLPWSSTL